MKVLAVDPGKCTGYAGWHDGRLMVVEQRPLHEALDFLVSWAFDANAIVCEKFTVTAQTLRKSREYDALEGIGALRWLAHRFSCDFELQAPADAKRLIDDERLKRLGWYASTPGGHQNDACRHLAYFLAKRGELRLP